MDLQLKDKTALVTGSSKGIGEAIAMALARRRKCRRPWLAWSLATIAVSSASFSASKMLIRCRVVSVVNGAAGFALTVPMGSFVGVVACF
jgi:hypothetical protein